MQNALFVTIEPGGHVTSCDNETKIANGHVTKTWTNKLKKGDTDRGVQFIIHNHNTKISPLKENTMTIFETVIFCKGIEEFNPLE